MLAVQDLSGDAAVVIELFVGHDGLVRGDLEDGVRRGIDDEVAGLQVLFAVILDDLGAGIGLVAEDAAARLFAERTEHILGETVRIRGQRAL